MFDPIMAQILIIARSAWGFLAGLLVIVALLGALYYILQGHGRSCFWRKQDGIHGHYRCGGAGDTRFVRLPVPATDW